MKKFSFLIYHNDYDLFLQDLRNLGLIHVAEQKKSTEYNDELETYLSQLKQLQEAKKTVEKLLPDNKEELQQNKADIDLGYTIPEKIATIQERIATINQELQVSLKKLEQLEPWGDFDTQLIKRLEQAGYTLRFFSVQKSSYNPEWETLYNAMVIHEATRYHFITFTKQDNVAQGIGLEPVSLPDVSYSELLKLIGSIEGKLAREKDNLKALAADIPSLDAAIADVESKIALKNVVLNTNKVADNKIMVMQGWAPEENEANIVSYLQAKDAYYQVSDPSPEDDVPIKLKNNKFFKLFEPITKLYMLPKYNELDLTPYFAPFFMLFFGLSLGDIGYGLFLFVGAAAAKVFMKSSMGDSFKSILSLVQVLGISAFFTGFLTGGFFGVQLYELDLPIAQKLGDRLYFNNDMMFSLALILGVVQVIFGMILKMYNRIIQFGLVHGVSTLGWITLLVSVIFAVLFPNILPMGGTVHLVILALSALAIFFINSPGKNIFLNFGLGFWDSYNMATGLLGDILSYVRLFALGLSGGILANVFTQLAVGMSPDNAIAGPIVTILIFVIGHGINIFMNTLGAIVHPLRLTFVEFFKNSEFTGGGTKYQPFT